MNSKKVNNKPDDYLSFGPIEIARLGNLNLVCNNSTPEQFDKIQTKLTEQFPLVCQEIDEKISKIVKEVSKYSPTELLKRAYWNMAGQHLKVKSEVEIDQEKSLSVRMIDYVQSIIASVEPFEGNEELDEKKWSNLKEMIGNLFKQLNIEYQICRTAFNRSQHSNFDIDFEEYYYQAQIYWCNVRGHRYQYHEKIHLQDILIPHSQVLNELFGITAEQLIDEIYKIEYSLTRGLIDTTKELEKFRDVILDALEKNIHLKGEVDEDGLPDLVSGIIAENNWHEWRENIFGRFSGLDLFDLEKTTNLPKKLLEELSWSPGQDTEFFAEGNFKGWPLRIWPVFKRPFIKLNGQYYCFELFNLLDNIYRVLQKVICRIKPDYRKEWNDKQKAVSEELPFKYLNKILPKANIYQSVYYKWYTSPQKKEWCETDGILIFEDHLFIIEVKAGAFTYTSPATDFPAYIESLKNLIFKPAEQGNRFLAYLESEGKVDIFDSNHEKITEISKDDFECKNICVVTIDNFTELASQIQHLKKIGIDVGTHPVWAISLDDLRVYSDIFENSLVFLHFVEQRMQSFYSSLIQTNDELDHLGLYLKHNIYTEYVKAFDPDSKIIWNGYRSDIDRFFTNKLQDPSTPCPLQQGLPERLREIIDFLHANDIQGRRKIASLLLDCGETFRDKIAKGIGNILIHQKKYSKIEITLFLWRNKCYFILLASWYR